MNEIKYPVAVVVNKFRTDQKLSLRGFAEALTNGLRNTRVSYSAVSRWEQGEDEPNTDFLLMCMIVYSDWRMEFAINALCAKLPEVFARDENGALTTLKYFVPTAQ